MRFLRVSCGNYCLKWGLEVLRDIFFRAQAKPRLRTSYSFVLVTPMRMHTLTSNTNTDGFVSTLGNLT